MLSAPPMQATISRLTPEELAQIRAALWPQELTPEELTPEEHRRRFWESLVAVAPEMAPQPADPAAEPGPEPRRCRACGRKTCPAR